jgi:uncharacterized protein YqeY
VAADKEDGMSIEQRLREDLKTAMRARDALRKTTIRGALAALKNAQVAKNAALTDDEEIAVLSKEAKQLRDAIVDFKRGNRDDLVAEATAQIDILQEYLPRALGRQEITDLARTAIAETGASSPRQMGQVMGVLMPQVRGRADGKVVSEIVRKLLADQGG